MGKSATYLQHAADLIETLAARVIAASDEEDLWRHKYETLTRRAEALEAQCDTLKHDIEGHLDITSSMLTERDALGVKLQAREAEFSELRDAFNRERGELATKLEAQEEVVAGLRVAFDRERDALAASDRERGELQAQLKAREDELAAFRREQDALKEKVAALEAKRAELRSAFDRIGSLRNQTIEHQTAPTALFPESLGVKRKRTRVQRNGRPRIPQLEKPTPWCRKSRYIRHVPSSNILPSNLSHSAISLRR